MAVHRIDVHHHILPPDYVAEVGGQRIGELILSGRVPDWTPENLYCYEPGGNRVEIYTSGFFVLAPDFEPVVWDEHSRGTGVYWGAALPETFMTYATPDVPAEGQACPASVDPL